MPRPICPPIMWTGQSQAATPVPWRPDITPVKQTGHATAAASRRLQASYRRMGPHVYPKEALEDPMVAMRKLEAEARERELERDKKTDEAEALVGWKKQKLINEEEAIKLAKKRAIEANAKRDAELLQMKMENDEMVAKLKAEEAERKRRADARAAKEKADAAAEAKRKAEEKAKAAAAAIAKKKEEEEVAAAKAKAEEEEKAAKKKAEEEAAAAEIAVNACCKWDYGAALLFPAGTRKVSDGLCVHELANQKIVIKDTNNRGFGGTYIICPDRRSKLYGRAVYQKEGSSDTWLYCAGTVYGEWWISNTGNMNSGRANGIAFSNKRWCHGSNIPPVDKFAAVRDMDSLAKGYESSNPSYESWFSGAEALEMVKAKEQVVAQAAGSIKLTCTEAFDRNGVMWFIGTKSLNGSYANPHNAPGGVVAKMSSTMGSDGSPERLTNNLHNGEENYSGSHEQNACFSVDLGEGRSLVPNHYCLRHGSSGSDNCLRSWKLEASNDEQAWTTLKVHSNDSSLPASKFSTAAWPIDASAGFRFFRIIKSDPGYLVCSGMEFYGTLN